jgi:hypothetical protein
VQKWGVCEGGHSPIAMSGLWVRCVIYLEMEQSGRGRLPGGPQVVPTGQGSVAKPLECVQWQWWLSGGLVESAAAV